jgi:hypothetical protein
MARKKPKSADGGLDENPAFPVTAEERHRMIAEAAYYRALHRGFSGGSSDDDWLQAEREVNHALLKPTSGRRKSGATSPGKQAASAIAENR